LTGCFDGWLTGRHPFAARQPAHFTGATGGLGYETALGASPGPVADVILTGRDERKGQSP